MAKITRGSRMRTVRARAGATRGGTGAIAKRPAGRRVLRT